ncbi:MULTISPECIES: hypothetical protein [unclassified Tolypothrix]|uniref:hypothetical protein n=1 Tax=unclassified Tolypothrix TaxID=2649714 RepID=UPI0005EAC206|nr:MULTISPECIES: hypothetical protein [unclassified Tolypothrix]BAY88306.1 hypothetical protein NIES3275_02810 [Microchaete diplosiphon NIES-3275]EKF02343.1 hypothetical protein FDUTEX481_07067 [Tolypothrix sp. PCC 7601]MBE9082374.1 hypothetical protein [Tolypothrix sp. LEGE 11397]UYD28999.1 hypothetical protein HGR01_13745 [Tolypothrix sp. PCC 7712]UYD35087.1 hypothetical protein HG267_04595 [Tolypothrix sp. PCC 7601]
MTLTRGRRILAALLLSVLLLTSACSAKTPGRFDQAQQESSRQKSGQAVAKNATQGSKLNKFFPSGGDGYQRVYTQEKKGFSEANLKKGGKVVAQLAISDTTSTPTAAAKFSNSSKKVAGYPAVTLGNTQTSILVGKYQVKAISKDPTFTATDREAWLEKFDLNGLARLK